MELNFKAIKKDSPVFQETLHQAEENNTAQHHRMTHDYLINAPSGQRRDQTIQHH